MEMILQSETLGKIADALCKAQAAFPAIHKDREVSYGATKYDYATLANIMESVRKPLIENGLALIQRTLVNYGPAILETRLIHTSGEWIASHYPYTATGKAQEIGSAITYARRYSLTAILGIVPDDDDDANAADQTGAVVAPKQTSKPKAESKAAPGSADAGAAAMKYANAAAAEINEIQTMQYLGEWRTANFKKLTNLAKYPEADQIVLSALSAAEARFAKVAL